MTNLASRQDTLVCRSTAPVMCRSISPHFLNSILRVFLEDKPLPGITPVFEFVDPDVQVRVCF